MRDAFGELGEFHTVVVVPGMSPGATLRAVAGVAAEPLRGQRRGWYCIGCGAFLGGQPPLEGGHRGGILGDKKFVWVKYV